MDHQDIIPLTADIVSAHLSHNSVAINDVPILIQSVFDALTKAGKPPVVVEKRPEPAVSIRASVKHDYIVCLEDGKRLKMLKRHLMTHYKMTPDEYRARWNLPADYPMVAPAYAETRRELAKSIGLGRKLGAKIKKPAAKAATKPAKGAGKAPVKKVVVIAQAPSNAPIQAEQPAGADLA
jgi:predicted transcriptional regulator